MRLDLGCDRGSEERCLLLECRQFLLRLGEELLELEPVVSQVCLLVLAGPHHLLLAGLEVLNGLELRAKLLQLHVKLPQAGVRVRGLATLVSDLAGRCGLLGPGSGDLLVAKSDTLLLSNLHHHKTKRVRLSVCRPRAAARERKQATD